jgi:hypothetical protein
MYFLILLFVFSIFSAPPDNINNIMSDEDLQTVACTPETSPCRAFGEDGSPLLQAVDPWDVLFNEENLGIPAQRSRKFEKWCTDFSRSGGCMTTSGRVRGRPRKVELGLIVPITGRARTFDEMIADADRDSESFSSSFLHHRTQATLPCALRVSEK